ncbi:MAG: LLM class flavin-dependent oxidoreductase [Agriterribacter sp.]
MKRIPLSTLDLAIVTEGGNAATAIERTVSTAQHVEKLGYKRIWLAEHHNMENIASSATSVLIGHVAGSTTTIRVGSGGIMLPNHSPLAIAEQFGTLETLYPRRIDLGLGRAPGTDQLTASALRRNNNDGAYNFPVDIRQLQTYFSKENQQSRVRAFPGEGLDIPIWILGSSTDSAYLAAEMGLPYAFAAHFAPAQFRTAIQIYRRHFQPSRWLSDPYVLACVNVIAADTDEEAQYLATSLYRMFVGIFTNARRPLSPPVKDMEPYWTPDIRHAIAQMTACTFIGSRETLEEELLAFIEETKIDELMASCNMYDQQARLHSYTILNEVLSAAKVV